MTLPERFPKQFSYGKLVTKCFVETMLQTKKWQFLEDYDGTVDDIIFKRDLKLLNIELSKEINWQVKGEKNIDRQNPDLTKVNQVLEFKVEDKYHKQRPGWLYGKYEAIAFYAGTHFICIDRLKLVEFAERVRIAGPVLEKWGGSNEVEYYKEYCRRSNYGLYDHPNERFMYVPLSDLLSIKHFKVRVPNEFRV